MTQHRCQAGDHSNRSQSLVADNDRSLPRVWVRWGGEDKLGKLAPDATLVPGGTVLAAS